MPNMCPIVSLLLCFDYMPRPFVNKWYFCRIVETIIGIEKHPKYFFPGTQEVARENPAGINRNSNFIYKDIDLSFAQLLKKLFMLCQGHRLHGKGCIIMQTFLLMIELSPSESFPV